MPKQGDVELLNDPVAQEMLQAPFPARLSYVWKDGTPRVVPIMFHWSGTELVVSGPTDAPKMKVLENGTRVAVTIDSNEFPNKVLMIRGPVAIDEVEGLPPEYVAATERFLGKEGADAWIATASQLVKRSARIKITPEWVGVLDFQTRFPSAIEKAMSPPSGG